MTRRRADAVLIAACAIWGVSFPTVKVALADASPLAFVALRFLIAAVVLWPATPMRPRFSGAEVRAGLLLGTLLATGFAAQAVGLASTTPSRSAFIVAMSSVLAPLVAWAVVREHLAWWTLAALGVAAAGMYFLTDPGGGGLNRGDIWTLLTAAVFGGQIVATRELGRRHDVRRLVWMQVAFTAVVVGALAPWLEPVRVEATPRLFAALGYTGIAATAGALLLQMYAQRQMSSARAALLFCSEPLFASLSSWLWLGERLAAVQWLGGALIVAGMILADLPPSRPSTEPAR